VFLEHSRKTVDVCLVFLVAEDMAKFVSNGKIEKVFHTHPPREQQFAPPLRNFGYQGFLEECLAFLVVSEGRRVRPKSAGHYDGFPVLGSDQNPGPFPEVGDRVLGERLA
jgi:hypothetical protein